MSDKNKKAKKHKRLPVIIVCLLIMFAAGAAFVYFYSDDDVKAAYEEFLRRSVFKEEIADDSESFSDSETLKEESGRTREALKDTSATIAVLKIGEETVYYPEFAFYMLASKKRYEQRFGRDIWSMEINGEHADGLLREDVAEELIQLKIIVKEAEKAGMFLDEAENKEILSVAAEQIAGIDPVIAAKYYIDADIIAKAYRENFLANKFFKNYSVELQEDSAENIFKELYMGWKESYPITVYEDKLNEMDLPEIDI